MSGTNEMNAAHGTQPTAEQLRQQMEELRQRMAQLGVSESAPELVEEPARFGKGKPKDKAPSERAAEQPQKGAKGKKKNGGNVPKQPRTEAPPKQQRGKVPKQPRDEAPAPAPALAPASAPQNGVAPQYPPLFDMYGRPVYVQGAPAAPAPAAYASAAYPPAAYAPAAYAPAPAAFPPQQPPAVHHHTATTRTTTKGANPGPIDQIRMEVVAIRRSLSVMLASLNQF